MSAGHRLALVAALLLLVGARDRAPAPGGWAAPAAIARRGAAAAQVPAFVIFGWASPPVESTSVARIREMAAAGLDLVLPALEDSGRVADNLARLDAAAPLGMRCIVWDRRFEEVDTTRAEGRAQLDEIVASYRAHPAFFAYYLGDEPPEAGWPVIEPLFAALAARDPAHPAWNNLFGRRSFSSRGDWSRYVNGYLDRLQPAVLCDDEYDFLRTGDAGHFVENAAGLREWSHARGIPFWSIVLLTPHLSYRPLTEGELKWQVSTLLAYGARGIGYFTYWTPRPDPQLDWHPGIIGPDGRPTAWYDVLARWNPVVRAAGTTLAGTTWLLTVHAGSVPLGGARFVPDGWVRAVEGRAALGYFSGPGGQPHLVVANSDSLGAQRVTLTIPGRHAVERLAGAAGGFEPLGVSSKGGETRIGLDLEPGGFALLRLGGDFPDGLEVGNGPALRISPNPARGAVQLSISGLAGGARVEILDAGGRVVWARDLAPGDASISWQGGRSQGGTVAPGVYFARVEDARGVTAARLSWLGR